jgi:predicted metal-dependent RNase
MKVSFLGGIGEVGRAAVLVETRDARIGLGGGVLWACGLRFLRP